jgi:hypothetical protein
MLAPAKNAPAHDLVSTPPKLAQMIVDHFAPSGTALDPARGSGVFYTALLSHTDDVDWCEDIEGRNFFDYNTGVDWIITNPPWSKFRQFLQHGYRCANHVVYVGTFVHFVTRARLVDARTSGFGLREALLLPQPSAPGPSSGFQLVAMHLQRGWTAALTINNRFI